MTQGILDLISLPAGLPRLPDKPPAAMGSALNKLSAGYASANIGWQLFTYVTTGQAQTLISVLRVQTPGMGVFIAPDLSEGQ